MLNKLTQIGFSVIIATSLILTPIKKDNSTIIIKAKSLSATVIKQKTKFNLNTVPKFKKSRPYVVVNGNKPYFRKKMLKAKNFEKYSKLDNWGRCGVVAACLDEKNMSDENRGSISSIYPSGWHSYRYSNVSGGYLYNRCHLIGYQLSAENANEKNLITGTRYLNIEGMLPFENMVADYIEETGNHVLYRVTPIYKGKELVARGVLMEARSIEDDGEGIEYCVYCYNNQPGIKINYKTGTSSGKGKKANKKTTTTKKTSVASSNSSSKRGTYAYSASSTKFHYKSCRYVSQINKANLRTCKTRKKCIKLGLDPCKVCNP